MEIDRTSAARPRHLTPVPPSVPSGTSPVASEREAAQARLDRIELSSDAREVQSEPEAAREAKLAALRAQIDAGTYRMDANGVARRIVARDDL
ncbi:MAG: flagellar biosynthesis anti-sigma factor FlgM [Dehalococcoidia bacterium]